MKPAERVQIRGTHTEVVLAKNQKQYLPLPVVRHGDFVTSRWEFTLVERLKVLFRGHIFISMMNFEQPPMPLKPSVEEPEWLLPEGTRRTA